MNCLQALFNQSGLGEVFKIEVFLVDDGSTDGTSSAIRVLYPKVNIVQGDGNLYWNRGMHLAWKTAYAVKDFDYYMWLNDDTFLFINSLNLLFKESFPNSIVCGVTMSSVSEHITYGGYINQNKKLLNPNGFYQRVDYCNGNCVLIPRNVFYKLGNLDPIFNHALGDFDYSLRARSNNIEIFISSESIGYCERHENEPQWQSSIVKVSDRIKKLYLPSSACNPIEFFIFERRHYGIIKAIFHFITLHIRALFPSFWKIKRLFV